MGSNTKPIIESEIKVSNEKGKKQEIHCINIINGNLRKHREAWNRNRNYSNGGRLYWRRRSMRVGTSGVEEQVVPSAPRLASKSATSFP